MASCSSSFAWKSPWTEEAGGLQSVVGFPGGSVVKNLPANEGDTGLIPGAGRSPGVGSSNLLEYSCLGNSMDRGAWQGVAELNMT